jgi:hypothetical protein
MTAERFWSRVDRGDGLGCWLWTGAVAGKYGVVGVARRTVGAHRYAWEITHGPLTDGQVVMHECDTPVMRPPRPPARRTSDREHGPT